MFWNIFYALCAKKGLSPNKAANELNIASGTLSEWKKGRMPRQKTLKRIAEYFDVPTEYLLGMDVSLGEEVYRARRIVNSPPLEDLTDDELEKVVEYAEFLKTQRKKKI